MGTAVHTANITELGDGNYTIDVIMVDVFTNEAVYSDVGSFTVGEFPEETTTTEIPLPLDVIVIGSVIGCVVVIIALIAVKKRGN